MGTAFERNNGEINIYKTKRNGKRVEVIEVLSVQDRIKKKTQANQKEEIFILLALGLAFLLTAILIINIF